MIEFDDGVILVNTDEPYSFKGMARWFPKMKEDALILDMGEKVYFLRCTASWSMDLTIFHKQKKWGQVRKFYYSLTLDKDYFVSKYSWEKVPQYHRPHVTKLIERAKEIFIPIWIMQNH